jgi:pantoate--beta-alanine ligase
VHPETLADVPEWYRGEALLAVAARIGTTRLIDNTPVVVGPGGGAIDVFSDGTPGDVARPGASG